MIGQDALFPGGRIKLDNLSSNLLSADFFNQFFAIPYCMAMDVSEQNSISFMSEFPLQKYSLKYPADIYCVVSGDEVLDPVNDANRSAVEMIDSYVEVAASLRNDFSFHKLEDLMHRVYHTLHGKAFNLFNDRRAFINMKLADPKRKMTAAMYMTGMAAGKYGISAYHDGVPQSISMIPFARSLDVSRENNQDYIRNTDLPPSFSMLLENYSLHLLEKTIVSEHAMATGNRCTFFDDNRFVINNFISWQRHKL